MDFPKEHPVPCARTSIDDDNTFRRFPPSRFNWSPELLPSFTFLMSGHGVPVCASMMVGDAAYAREQLRLACTFEDQVLQQLAVAMLRPVAQLRPARSETLQASH